MDGCLADGGSACRGISNFQRESTFLRKALVFLLLCRVQVFRWCDWMQITCAFPILAHLLAAHANLKYRRHSVTHTHSELLPPVSSRLLWGGVDRGGSIGPARFVPISIHREHISLIYFKYMSKSLIWPYQALIRLIFHITTDIRYQPDIRPSRRRIRLIPGP